MHSVKMSIPGSTLDAWTRGIKVHCHRITRLLFKDGKVDPLKTASFEFLVTDYTPRWTFYLVQDPRIPTG
ncbi:hypothetical protein [Mesorhizobium sp. NZP2077]|uniref:hypothetical protein n=1 Tax=Mesorhizobium sp. NZP2077 TaxID=2483404 RepID=UPI001551CC0E|nr:hypothetical protein [Mesorhizobium sp. NZP2077]QKC84701.1 hypothetical protein EB232_26735 [Mesorhizobium sp. NZP2077]QKD13596.1 hypothetical protein HGP13_26455 [Mesorhizobium sp. NZP2077]